MRLGARPVVAALAALAAVVYATYSLVRWSQYGNGGFDLGIFDQVVWHYSRFETPASSIKGLESIWGDHFSPVLMLLAPLYWVWEDARMLLLAQAVLVAAAAIPVFLVCEERVGRRPAVALAAAYLAFWGVASAIAFDVHEVAFAPVVLASLLLAVQRGAWRWYAALVLALLCVKEDQAILVVFVGIYVASLGHLRRGALTAVAGVAWYLLVMEVIVPPNNPLGFSYWSYDAFGDDPVSAVGGVLRDPLRVLTTFVDAPAKRETLTLLVLPFLGLCLLSREVILLAPMFAERFLSSTQNYWGTEAHYTLVSAAVLVIGAAGGLRLVARRIPPRRRGLVLGGGAGAILVVNLLVATGFPLRDLARPAFYDRAPVWQAADRALAAVPGGVSVAAQDNVLPRLTQRDVAAEISAQTGPTDYLVAYLTAPLGTGQEINGGFAGLSRFVDDRLGFYAPIAYEEGWLVLRSRALPARPRAASLARPAREQAARLARALGAWEATHAARVADATACVTAARGPCPGPRRFGAAGEELQATLDAVGPRLAPGCAELAGLARLAAAQLVTDLDAVYAAAARTPFDAGALQAAGAAAGQRLELNGLGYVVRFRRLCVD